MRRHFQIKNLVLSLATFCLGIAAASLFSTSHLPPSGEEPVLDSRRSFEVCVPDDHAQSERWLFHTERERLLMDRIRVTEKKLAELRRRNYISSPKAEREAIERQHQLEVKLRILKEQLKEEVLRSAPSQTHDKPGSTKLIYRQRCYER